MNAENKPLTAAEHNAFPNGRWSTPAPRPTPTPWFAHKSPYDGKTYIVDSAIVEGRPFSWQVIHTPSSCPDNDANSALIVRAVNSHAELLAALKQICALPGLRNAGMGSDAYHAWLIAGQAIAKAEGRAA